MKTRSGFVSNSSSSSFVVVTTKEKWDAACKAFSDKVGKNIARIVISEYGKGTKAKVLGKDALVFQGVMSSEEFGNSELDAMRNDGTITEEEADNLMYTAYDHAGDLEVILKKDGVSYISSYGC